MEKVILLGGRAHRLLPEIIAQVGAAYRKGFPCLLLVPEQYTLQAELELIQRLSLPGFFNIQVLSPSRLTQRIFDAAGTDGRVPIDTRGKQIALSRSLLSAKNKLTYYARATGQRGFVEKLSTLIADFKRGNMTPAMLSSYAETLPQGTQRLKFSDMALAWAGYEEQLSGRFVDGEDVQAEAVNRLAKSGLCQDACVFVYGFDILPPAFCRLLTQAAVLCAKLTVALLMDRPTARDGHLFRPVRKSAVRFSQLLKAAGIPYQWTYLPFTPLASAPAIAHLEENLFAYPAKVYEGPPEGIFLHAAPNPYAEVHQAAAHLMLLHKQGIPWQEMAVVAGSMDAYGNILHAVFSSYRIPFYLEEKTPAISHGLIRFLLFSLRAATRGYLRSDVLTVVKSGYAPLPLEACYQLENYALAYGISGDRWRKPFTRGNPEEIATMEPARKALIAPLETLRNALREAREATDSLRAIFSLLEQVNAYETLQRDEERLLSLNMAAQASQNRQVWQFILGTLDQMHDLLAGSRAPSAHVASWLEAGFAAGQLSSLPPTPGAVLLGEIGHAMPGTVQVLFALGLQDGLLHKEGGSLLRDEERLSLEQASGSPLGLTDEGRDLMARVDLVKTLSLPTARLYLSHAQAAQDGQAQRPAAFLTQLRSRLFPGLVESGGVTGPTGAILPLSPEPALHSLALRLSALWDGTSVTEALPGPWLDAWTWLISSPEYQKSALAILNALTQRIAADPLKPETAAALFGKQTMSASRLEEYAQCPYRHFVHYGLQPVPRKEWAVAPADVGTFFHEAMRGFTEKAKTHKAWPEISRQECNDLMGEVLQPLTKLWEDGPLSDNAQCLALGQRYIRIIQRAAWMFTRHAKESSFRPSRAEVSFGFPESILPPISLSLPDGSIALVRGIIDRVDRYQGDEGVYIRVVDYKSGARELDPAQLWYGLQMQLLLYLMAALPSEKGAQPAGAFYFHVDDPLAEVDSDLAEAAEEKIAEKLRLKGISLADVQITRAMDHQEEGFSLGNPLKKDGTPKQNALALTLEQMNELLAHAKDTAQALAGAMRQGRIDIAPVRTGTLNACEYCEYATICRWDPRLPGARPRMLAPLTMEDLRAALTPGGFPGSGDCIKGKNTL